jgi:hexosaminidase
LNEPFREVRSNITEEYLSRAWGGEVAIWGELVDDSNIISKSWPRAAAAGERLWSPATVTNPREALPRILKHRQRLILRGIRAEPLQPLWCNYNPGHCNSSV